MDERSDRGMNNNVTVIGAGRMASALATVLFHKGFATTVWNRTGAKTEVLSRLGLSVAQSVEESVREADIVVVSVSDYSSRESCCDNLTLKPPSAARSSCN